MPTDPLATPPPPPVERLNRAVLLAAALIVMITLLVVAFVVSPRQQVRPAAPPQPPFAAGAPGFLNRPPGSLPPAPQPPMTDQDYLRSLFERAGPEPQPSPLQPPPVLAAAPPPMPPASSASPAAPPPPPRDPRREEFFRALRAPLAEQLPPATLPGRGLPPLAAAGAPPFARSYQLPAGDATATSSASAADSAEELDDSQLSVATGPPRPSAATATGSGGPAGARATPTWTAATAPGSTPAAGDGTIADGATAAGAEATPPSASWPPAPWPPTSWPPRSPRPAATAGALAPRTRSAAAAPTGSGEPPPAAGLALVVRPPTSAATLAAGTLIPALLETEVNSDLPGPLLAQVSRDVYDFRQRSILVPRGTRLLGAYQNQVAVGQRRLLVAWTRLTFPDGSACDLPGLPGIDPSGAAGLTARVHNHLLRLFGDALLLSLLSAGADLSQPQNRNLALAPSAGSVASAAVGQELASVGVQLLRRDLSLQPTLRLAAGTPLVVFVNGDLDLARPARSPRP
ncbi:MAG TPA: TrbI/VirB10 family protein [Thermoanaerobaculia bacterium]|nr:TrbI/VirB10 family protein [Thermoanaerobaculia bacterium]